MRKNTQDKNTDTTERRTKNKAKRQTDMSLSTVSVFVFLSVRFSGEI